MFVSEKVLWNVMVTLAWTESVCWRNLHIVWEGLYYCIIFGAVESEINCQDARNLGNGRVPAEDCDTGPTGQGKSYNQRWTKTRILRWSDKLLDHEFIIRVIQLYVIYVGLQFGIIV